MLSVWSQITGSLSVRRTCKLSILFGFTLAVSPYWAFAQWFPPIAIYVPRNIGIFQSGYSFTSLRGVKESENEVLNLDPEYYQNVSGPTLFTLDSPFKISWKFIRDILSIGLIYINQPNRQNNLLEELTTPQSRIYRVKCMCFSINRMYSMQWYVSRDDLLTAILRSCPLSCDWHMKAINFQHNPTPVL